MRDRKLIIIYVLVILASAATIGVGAAVGYLRYGSLRASAVAAPAEPVEGMTEPGEPSWHVTLITTRFDERGHWIVIEDEGEVVLSVSADGKTLAVDAPERLEEIFAEVQETLRQQAAPAEEEITAN